MKTLLYIAIIISIGFVILSLPNAYVFTDSVIPKNYIRITFDNCPGIPTTQGILFHAFIFCIFTFIVLLLKYKKIEKVLSPSSETNTTTDIKTVPIDIKHELPIRRKLSSPEPTEMDPIDMYDE